MVDPPYESILNGLIFMANLHYWRQIMTGQQWSTGGKSPVFWSRIARLASDNGQHPSAQLSVIGGAVVERSRLQPLIARPHRSWFSRSVTPRLNYIWIMRAIFTLWLFIYGRVLVICDSTVQRRIVGKFSTNTSNLLHPSLCCNRHCAEIVTTLNSALRWTRRCAVLVTAL